MTKKIFSSVQNLNEVGSEVGVSDWLTITQNRIDQFAGATNDMQWIHVDADRARKEVPGGLTIAHGYLTLSLIAGFLEETLEIQNVNHVINYGLNKVRFITPVPVNGRLRAHFAVVENTSVTTQVVQVIWRVTIELEGSAKPACVAEIIFRYYV